MTLDELFADAHLLPTVPKVVFDLIEMLRSEDASVPAVARKLELDQVLTARVLRMVNSPYFGLRRKIVSIQDAIQLLGFSAIRSLVVSSGLKGTFQKVDNVDLPAFWAHSLRVAAVARYLAGKTRGIDHSLAFTVGSMHAIGHLIMARAMKDEMARLNAVHPFDAMGRLEVEAQKFGYHYGDVSARLAARWEFASEFTSALACFANPMESGRTDALANVLHLAVWRVALEREGLPIGDTRHVWPAASADAIGLSEEVVHDMPAPRELASDLESMIA
ncbi:HD-like signal output (HDOD) protein [Variovorax sp. TBS-050B]|uniref:HDOD domain-containing protein n=1 Tax=Variovorax sp. TBS-050B TaxID=2940551 RepID=UPI002473DBA0|nr:HDOD domain-containing protein [Variovorax sp. TBS-050B]MDH6590528.1 HD-like signal output (HDOD) protein [Variovorax sp. TBS-050B]